MKIINSLTIKNLIANKKRSLVTLIAIVLASTLIFSLGFIISTYRENEIAKVKYEVGSYDCLYENIKYQDISKINIDIFKISYIFNIEDNLYGISDNITDEIKLKEGSLPKNKSEIVVSNKEKIKLNDYFDNKKVVGISLDSNNYILENPKSETITNFYVYFKNKKDIYTKIFDIAKKLGLEFKYEIGLGDSYIGASPNQQLLEMYGNIRNNVKMAILFLSLLLLLTIISIACTIVIYNSFAISVIERKKHLGVLASIGATKKQLFKMVILEGLILFLIATPLGFIISTILVNLGIIIVNSILGNANSFPYEFSIYPLFIIMSLIFIFLTVFFSSFFPAKRASEVTPIEAIRQTKDFKRTKVKQHTLINKLFGIVGVIARKNMLRNKKKYRITILSIVISVVLFITVSTFIYQYEVVINENLNMLTETIDLYIKSESQDTLDNLNNQITGLKEVDDYLIYKENSLYLNKQNSNEFYPEYLDKKNDKSIRVITFNDKKYNQLKQELNIDSDAILINKKMIDYQVDINTLREKLIPIYKDNSKPILELCNYNVVDMNVAPYDCEIKYKNIYLLNKIPKSLEKYQNILFSYNQTLIISPELFNQIPSNIFSKDHFINIRLISSKFDIIDSKIEKILVDNQESISYYEYNNNALENNSFKKSLLVAKFVLYSLIFLFSLIATTSIVNTTYLNIKLRSKELAVLRSIGLTPKDFNKMINLESIFICVKSLIYSLIISSLNIFLIYKILGFDKQSADLFEIPVKYILLSIVFVFIIVVITMILSSKSIKKSNIIDTLRSENI